MRRFGDRPVYWGLIGNIAVPWEQMPEAQGLSDQEQLLQWAEWFGNIENRRIARTEIDRLEISTVFLGMDHQFGLGGPPLIFETMIFCIDRSQGKDLYMERYSTWEQAIHGHDRIVQAVRDGTLVLEGYNTPGSDDTVH